MTGIILKIPRLRVSVVDSLTVYENDKSSSFQKSPFWDTRTWIKSPFWDTLCAFLFFILWDRKKLHWLLRTQYRGKKYV